MKYLKTTVKFLTLFASFTLASCSLIYERYAESCKTHAYINQELQQFITSRFHYNSPVRMAIIPFSVAANLTAKDSERPGLGNEIAWQVQAQLLESKAVPIVEVFNRQDWPYKKEEFFTGNFGGIDMAREAGYDLIMIGYVEPQNSIYEITSFVKILDAESGVTVYYGKVLAETTRPKMDDVADTLLMGDKVPALTFAHELEEKISTCIGEAVLADSED
jgi:hypothetical protein